MMLATVSVTVIWGAILIVVGSVHLAFRRYFAHRSAVMQRAHREAAPTVTRRLHWVGSESANQTLTTLISVAFVIIGVVLVAAGASS